LARPAFLRNITHRILWTVTLMGTVGLCVYWVVLREPQAEWRILAMGLLLAVALGWWPAIAASIGGILALAAWFFAPGEAAERFQVVEEILAFAALGLGWGVLLRGILLHAKPSYHVRPVEPSRGFEVTSQSSPSRSTVTPQAPKPAGFDGLKDSTPAPRSAPPVPAPAPSPAPAPTFVAPPTPQARPEAVVELPPPPAAGHETTMDAFVMPGLTSDTKPATSEIPARPSPPPQRPTPPVTSPIVLDSPTEPPPRVSAPVPMAAPLFTQEVDLADFRAFVASQQADPGPSSSASDDPLPVNRVSGRNSEARTPLAPPPPPGLDPSTVAGDPSSAAPDPNLRRSSAMSRPETDPGAPHESVLEWYNQFSWSPWKAEELEKRYYRHGQKISWDALALQDLVRAWKVWRNGPVAPSTPAGYTTLWVLEGFLRCETLGLLRQQGHPDLHLLSREERSEAWMAVYRETRGRLRGGSPVLRPIREDLVAEDPERRIMGKPDALVEVGGESDVIAFVTPLSPGEAMTWSSVYACAQFKLAERLGVVVTHNPIVMRLPMPHWDERRQPRLHEVEDRTTEFRKLDAALERLQKILTTGSPPRSQSHSSVCNGCGARHACPSYSGNRPRLDLGNPPALLRKFLQ
jgi:hypothetical protein